MGIDMTIKEKVKRIRTAAHYISKWPEHKSWIMIDGKHCDTQFSCLALHDAGGNRQEYAKLYDGRLYPSHIGDCFTEQTQLHRQLLLELYALLVENGEIKKIK